jgi:hypothetical protein
VPTISSFHGILVRMYYGDHPPPHIHVRYGEHKARFAIATGERLDGRLPRAAERMVREWVLLRRAELDDNWIRCERLLPLQPVEPLP